MFGCQQVLIKPDKELKAVLEFICGESNKLHNCAVYYARQMYFKARVYVRPFDLINELKRNPHYGALCAQAAQQTCGAVGESVKSFKGLIKLFREGGLEHRPKFPNYRTKDGLHLIAYPKQALGKKLIDGQISIPLGQKVQTWFGVKNFTIQMPSNLDYAVVREVRILPRNGQFYAEFVYKTEAVYSDVDPKKVLGIDHGIDNWLTCVSNVGSSFIVDGRHLKALNQWYNKRVSTLMDGKSNGFWSHQLARITEKRNRQMRDAVNKAARLVVTHCLENRIGTVVFGWNKRQKDSASMGRKTNQKFVQIPTARLKKRIEQLCEQYGLQFVETEESYTSKASFIDRDFLPTIGAKPDEWKESGRRVKRGLYRTGLQNWYINADCNGAANIIRKVATMLGLDLNGVSRGVLTAPLKVRLWTLQESPRL
ncbi:transposase (plasmid) [Phormidium sp. CLA17]|uniref:RNA-guided endonuclease InsQ/TnpB family protein n=1 Tax=Leptolyngbya sp. Cla-17 TaxID=2803751 RepID=UPI001492116D|nr:RNA-guided endonuclease TnpB family protein [Leptolyngbya sp. Cla-17]MBM0745010.1 transposase [Leptolyngbya sp. Cla-17]